MSLDLGSGVKMELVLIPAGQFEMGSDENEPQRDPSEGPRHKVAIAHGFYMGKFPVTQAQWTTVLGNQSYFKGGNLPAEQVSWGDCQKFFQEISTRTGRTLRLPSEAEWEYACRAGTTTAFFCGDSLGSDQANMNGQEPYGQAVKGVRRDTTTPVGSFKPNAFGLYDMHGNVWEWCQDTFHGNYDGAPADGSAWMDAHEPLYVRRGGAWNNDGFCCRSAVRYAATAPEMRAPDTGFRAVIDVPSQGEH